MSDNSGDPGNENNWLGDIGGLSNGLSNKDRQRPLGGINDADSYPHFSPQLAKGIIGSHIAITQLPNVAPAEQSPGNIGRGDGAEKVTQDYYQP